MITSQFTPKVSEILAFSREEAARLASTSVGPEHLLLGLLREKDGPVIDVFRRLRLNLQSVKTELENKVRQDEIDRPINTRELVLNERASNILKLAVLEARTQHTAKVDEQHLLLAILHDQASNGAKQILEFNNMNYEDVLSLMRASDKSQTSNLIPQTASAFPMKTRRNTRRAAPRHLPTTRRQRPPSRRRSRKHPCSTTSLPTSPWPHAS